MRERERVRNSLLGRVEVLGPGLEEDSDLLTLGDVHGQLDEGLKTEDRRRTSPVVLQEFSRQLIGLLPHNKYNSCEDNFLSGPSKLRTQPRSQYGVEWRVDQTISLIGRNHNLLDLLQESRRPSPAPKTVTKTFRRKKAKTPHSRPISAQPQIPDL